MVALDKKAPNWLVQLLLKSGADPHLIRGDGRTVLHYAVMNQNVWATKWLIGENVDLEITDQDTGVSRPVLQDLIDYCDLIVSVGHWDINVLNNTVLNSFRTMQVLALAGTNQVGNSFSIKQTQIQLIKRISSFLHKLDELLKDPSFWKYGFMGKAIREIHDTVPVLIDMLCSPMSLRHHCRLRIRKSLGRDVRRKLHQLNIPLSLQAYLRIYNESDTVEWFLRWT